MPRHERLRRVLTPLTSARVQCSVYIPRAIGQRCFRRCRGLSSHGDERRDTTTTLGSLNRIVFEFVHRLLLLAHNSCDWTGMRTTAVIALAAHLPALVVVLFSVGGRVVVSQPTNAPLHTTAVTTTDSRPPQGVGASPPPAPPRRPMYQKGRETFLNTTSRKKHRLSLLYGSVQKIGGPTWLFIETGDSSVSSRAANLLSLLGNM